MGEVARWYRVTLRASPYLRRARPPYCTGTVKISFP
jgi:hypothetical protein